MQKKEADFSLILRHYLKANPLPDSCPIECKDTRGKDYFLMSELKEEQINNALASKSAKGNLIRISSGTIGCPDYAYYRNSTAPIFIRFPKFFCMIDIDDLIKVKKKLTAVHAQEIAIDVVFL